MTTKIEIDTDDPALIAKVGQALAGGSSSSGGGTASGGGSTSGGSTGGGTSTPPPTIDYFPADPATAPFPSPEGSAFMAMNGKAYLYDSSTKKTVQRDDAYIRSADGGIYQFKQPLELSTYNLYDLPRGYLGNLNGSPVTVPNWWQGAQFKIVGGICWCQVGNRWYYVFATGGTGDVLTGIVAAFLAKGLDAPLAAAAAAFAHGRAAQLGPERGLVASDLVDALPDVLA